MIELISRKPRIGSNCKQMKLSEVKRKHILSNLFLIQFESKMNNSNDVSLIRNQNMSKYLLKII